MSASRYDHPSRLGRKGGVVVGQSQEVEWMRPGEVARLWGVNRRNVASVASRRGVRSWQLYEGGETRYLTADVKRVNEEMRGRAS